MSNTDSEFVSTTLTLNAAGAKAALQAAEAYAAQQSYRVAIAVCDSAGNLLAFHRLDGASLVAGEACIRKARTAAQLRVPSKAFQDMASTDLVGVIMLEGLLAAEGGIPVRNGNVVIGAVGASGVTAEGDAAVAEAGANAVSS